MMCFLRSILSAAFFVLFGAGGLLFSFLLIDSAFHLNVNSEFGILLLFDGSC
jgi:hypothetical protein